jgi:2-keto-3-deoxy-L-fuconate dehydrogenase
MTATPTRLTGKTAIVTAAAQGIGRAIAERFHAEGATVHACDISAEHLQGLPQGVTTHVIDCTDEAAVNATFKRIGTVDILVNAVGWVFHGTILDTPPDAWKRSFVINVDTAYFAIRAVLPGMLAAGHGSIINIASPASSVKGFPNRTAYGATKAAMIGLTKGIVADYVTQGIRCNAICPGTVETPSLHYRINQFADPVAARAAFIARQPMGRLGQPEEIAALAAYMASDESAYMTGSVVMIDGGTVN